MSNNITISRDRLEELLNAERTLNALESAGVDNWDGYDWAFEEYEEVTDEDIDAEGVE